MPSSLFFLSLSLSLSLSLTVCLCKSLLHSISLSFSVTLSFNHSLIFNLRLSFSFFFSNNNLSLSLYFLFSFLSQNNFSLSHLISLSFFTKSEFKASQSFSVVCIPFPSTHLFFLISLFFVSFSIFPFFISLSISFAVSHQPTHAPKPHVTARRCRCRCQPSSLAPTIFFRRRTEPKLVSQTQPPLKKRNEPVKPTKVILSKRLSEN